MTLASGTRLGPYEILGQVGAGGMGEVYRARDTRLGREVAIKVLPSSLANDPDRLRRFEQEARAASALNHPNILTVHDVGLQGGVPYVVSELLEGQTLRERLTGGALPVRRVIDCGVQIAHGLAAAHEKGIVHRDLKPENLFVTKDDRLKILDFGLAKLTQPETVTGEATKAPTLTDGTEPGVVMGTVGYMSPEQIRGEAIDHRSDIFSFGAVLYEMLSGRRAFRGASAADTLSAILREEPPELASTNRQIPPSLDRAVRHCLEKSPQARFHAARDVAFALEEASGVSAAAPFAIQAPAGRRFTRLTVIGAALVALFVIAVFAIRPLRQRLFRDAPSGAIQSIAVLPLENFSHDPEQEYFADGMTEELITNLAQIRSLRVISRTSVMSYKGTKKHVPEIGRELNVDAVLEGSVQRSGQRVRITAQLVRAVNDEHLWAKSYERDLSDVFALQSEVAQAVAHEVKVAVTPDEQARLGRTRPVDPEVHELYLKGRFQLNKGAESEVNKAIDYFQRALAKDPSYAPAYAGLADSYVSLSDVYRPPFEVMPKARAAATRALELDETLTEAHASLSYVLLVYDWDWAGAAREAARALELNPNSADVHAVKGSYFVVLGRGRESVAELNRALRLDPRSLGNNFAAGWAHYMAREYEPAIKQFRRTVEMEPSFGWAHEGLAITHVQLGRCPEAIAEAEKGTNVDNSPLVLAMAGGVYASCERADAARDVLTKLAEISRTRYVCPYEIAIVHIGLGDKDEAFRYLEKGFRDRSVCMPFTKVDPRLDPIRSDPRYAELVRRLAFPP